MPESAQEPRLKAQSLRIKISESKQRALMKEFGLDDVSELSQEEINDRKTRLKALLKLGKTHGYVTHSEINDHLPDKMVEAETLEAVISMLSDMGVQVYKKIPDTDVTQRELAAAASEGHTDTVRLLLDKGADVNAADGYGQTALMAAVKNYHGGTVRLLLDKGANVNAADRYGMTALMVAANEKTHHHYATIRHVVLTRLLLQAGADVNATNKSGWTALMLAAFNGRHARTDRFARLLLDWGANVNAANENGVTALMFAVHQGCADIAHLLLDKGANADAAGKDGETALMLATENKHENIVRLLLDAGANANAVNKNKVTALMIAAQEGHTHIACLLLEKGADANAADTDGWTALMLATKNGYIDVVQNLLEHGAAPNAANANGTTALDLAEVIARILKDKGARNGSGASGKEVSRREIEDLVQAGCEGDEERMIILIGRGASGNDETSDGLTVLSRVVVKNTDGALLLLNKDKEADINATDRDGNTALLVVVAQGNFDAAQFLIDNGADVNCSNHDGKTALSIARENGEDDIVALLEQAGASE